ncbi:MAG: hypothetical protein KAU17_14185 [Spirochaetales bacterium]|jgi:hypothetical protein|nr:hypothetical protein [Spirochaetales bacterium]
MGKKDWNYMPLIIALVSVFGIAIGASLSYIATTKTQEKSQLHKQRADTYVDFIEAATRLNKLEALLESNQKELKYLQEVNELPKPELIKAIEDLKYEVALVEVLKATARFRVALSGSPNLLQMMIQHEVHSEYSNKSKEQVGIELFKAMRADLFSHKKEKETDRLICEILYPSKVINKPEKLGSLWVSAVREENLPELIRMSKLPFYFRNRIFENADELRSQYRDLLSKKDELDIKNAKYKYTKRIKDIEIGDENTELKSAISSLNLKEDEWLVVAEFKRPIKHRMFFLTQKENGRFKLVGITLKILQKEKEEEIDGTGLW